MNKTLLFLLLPGLLISCKPTPPSGDNGEIVPLTSECLLKNSDLYMKYPYKIKVQDSIMCIWDLHGGRMRPGLTKVGDHVVSRHGNCMLYRIII